MHMTTVMILVLVPTLEAEECSGKWLVVKSLLNGAGGSTLVIVSQKVKTAI